jgi:hypothetical protein
LADRWLLSLSLRDDPEPLFSRRSDPIEVTRPHRGPGSVFAATRGIFGVDTIGPNVTEAWLARFITPLPRPRSSGLDKTPKGGVKLDELNFLI